MSAPAVVLDTNIFVAAGFNPDSASARILDRVAAGDLRMTWNERSRRETETILRRIPPLSWSCVADLFRERDRFDGRTEPEQFDYITDPDDRKFAALCAASSAILVTNDHHLLDHRAKTGFQIVTPAELLRLPLPEADKRR